jgi:hypothetical protein
MNIKRIFLLVLLVVSSKNVIAQDQSPISYENVKGFSQLEKSRLGVILFDPNHSFKQYSKITILPVDTTGFVISEEAKKTYQEQWQPFKQNQLPQITEFLTEEFAEHFRKQSKKSSSKKKSGSNDSKELVLQFRLLDFLPGVDYESGTSGFVGQSFNLMGIGRQRIQVVFVDVNTRECVAIIDDVLNITAGRFASADSKASRNTAWKRSFEVFVDDFGKDYKRLKRTQG